MVAVAVTVAGFMVAADSTEAVGLTAVVMREGSLAARTVTTHEVDITEVSGITGVVATGRWHGGWRGWWGGAGLGLYLSVLPWDYETFWWGGTPIYYADNNYYVWDDDASEYQAVDPPADLRASAVARAPGSSANPVTGQQLFAYPKIGQSDQQQARDREECGRWASNQAGTDITTTVNRRRPQRAASAAGLSSRRGSLPRRGAQLYGKVNSGVATAGSEHPPGGTQSKAALVFTRETH